MRIPGSVARSALRFSNFVETRRARLLLSIARGTATTTMALAISALVGFAIGSESLASLVPGRITMKPNTALAMIAMGIAVQSLASRPIGPRRHVGRVAVPERGFASLVASESVGGAVTRRLVPIAVGIPFLLVGAAQAAAERGYLDGEMATALLVVSLAAVMGAVVLHAAGAIHRLDGIRVRGEAQQVELAVERADGSRTQGTLSVAPLLDWERRVSGACAVLHEHPIVQRQECSA